MAPPTRARGTSPVPVVTAPVPPFQTFLDAHATTVYRFLTAAVGRQDADDCFQETFLAALRAYPKLRDAEHLDRWVLRIASRKAIDHHRTKRRLPALLDELPEQATDQPEPQDEILWKSVRELPARQRIAMAHRYVLDRSYAEIAELMGGTEEAARANVHQATKRLRELMT